MNKFSFYKIYARLANNAYNNDFESVGYYSVVDRYSDAGFQATLYHNTKTGEKVLAIRGTEFGKDKIDWDDLGADGLLALFGSNQQVSDLEQYYQTLLENNTINQNEKITVVGHSLGGFLTQYFSVVHNDIVDNAYTFNAPGLGGFICYRV